MAELAAALDLTPGQALGLVLAQPSLLYEQTTEVLAARLGELASVLQMDREAARQLALEQPVGSREGAQGGGGQQQGGWGCGLLRTHPSFSPPAGM